MSETPAAGRPRGTAAIPAPGQAVDTGITYSHVDHDPVTGLSPEDQRAVEALPPGSALLIVERGPNSGARFLLDADRTTAGRAADSDIFLDDVTVSRRHAEFSRVGNGFRVVDIGSLNGTYVNRRRIESAVLRSGDEVQIGKYRLVYYPSRHDVPTDDPHGDHPGSDPVGSAAGGGDPDASGS
jgi:pSer/pThr/pTyr-binding forkhead associated (FHA) protein